MLNKNICITLWMLPRILMRVIYIYLLIVKHNGASMTEWIGDIIIKKRGLKI